MTPTHSYEEARVFIQRLTSEQCDDIALNSGAMSIVVEYPTMPNQLTVGRVIDGWTLFWIPINRNPSRWQLVLGSDSPRTHELAYEGRIRRLETDYHAPRVEAERYVAAAKGINFGFEDQVIRIVLERDLHKAAWDAFPGPSPAIRHWLRGYADYSHTAHNRLVTCNKIIKTLWGQPEVTDGGIATLESFNRTHNKQIPIPTRQATLMEAWS